MKLVFILAVFALVSSAVAADRVVLFGEFTSTT